jgi:hypothetical protein
VDIRELEKEMVNQKRLILIRVKWRGGKKGMKFKWLQWHSVIINIQNFTVQWLKLFSISGRSKCQ